MRNNDGRHYPTVSRRMTADDLVDMLIEPGGTTNSQSQHSPKLAV